MYHSKRLSRVVLVAAALAAAMTTATSAQNGYPNRTIKIVVPLPPGPVADVLPRIIGEKLATKWGQPVVIENRPGAVQNLGAEAVAKAEPDGYTLLATPPGPLVVSQHFFPKLGFDPTAFVPVTVMVKVPAVIVVNPKVPVSTVQELIAYSKANPNTVTYGSPGAGSTPQLAMEKLTAAAGIRLVHVPYQGLAPAMNDLLAGHIDVMIDNLGNVMQHIKDGRLKLIAATTEARIPELPDVPTVSETLPGVHPLRLVRGGRATEDPVRDCNEAVGGDRRSPEISRRRQTLGRILSDANRELPRRNRRIDQARERALATSHCRRGHQDGLSPVTPVHKTFHRERLGQAPS